MGSKVVSGIMLTLLLIGMLALASSIPAIAVDTDLPVDCDKGKLSKTNELADFANVDGDPAELVIGVNNTKPNSYAEIVRLIAENGGDLDNTVSMEGEIWAVVADVPIATVSSFVTEVRAAGLSRYVEPNMKFKLDLVPNDPDWPVQWGPRKIEADYAWNTTIGDPSIVVAVVDTGVDWNHPDLAANIWNNTDEFLDGIDNDGNGFIDDIRGWDFVDTEHAVWPGEDGTVRDNDPMDFYGHGTHCAGIAAAVANNSVGMAGVCWNCKIMPVRAGYTGEDGRGRLGVDDIAPAIIYAAENGADVISMSFGSSSPSDLVYDALKYAYDCGALLVAAAGNDHTDDEHFPAAYDEVIAVTATDEYDNSASFTNFGDWVEVAAPGVNIYSTVFDDSYASHGGTSMSAPHVAGVAALAWSVFPNATRDWVRVLLRNTADDLGTPGFDVRYGWGRINARKAVELIPPEHDVAIADWETPLCAEPGCVVLINTTVFNFGSNNETNITVQLLVNGSLVDSATIDFLETDASATVSCSWTPTEKVTYNLTQYVIPVPGENFTANNVVTTILAPLTTVVYVDPEISYAALGHTFSINVSIANFTDLYGYAFVLYWDNAILDCIKVVDTPPAVWGTNYLMFGIGLQQNYNSTHGMYQRVASALFPAPPFNGSTSLTTFTFRVIDAGECVLDLCDTEFSDTSAEPIPHKVEDGYFEYTPFEHDIVAFLEAPGHLMPGDSALLNATVLNGGLNNETDVELQLLINGSIVNSTVISFLQVNSSYTLSYLWTPPMVETTYNVTAYALPVPNEDFTLNNMESARVPVSYVIGVPFHFPTIQEAIDAANPGDTILVSIGTYYEHLTIDKSLTLAGEESSIPVIDGSGTGYVIHVRADNVDISDFTIQNGVIGVVLDSCEYNTIKDNTITNTRAVGIHLGSSDNNTISGNTVSNSNEYGVGLELCEYNTIKDNTIQNGYRGVFLDWCEYNTIKDNTITNNTSRGISLIGYSEDLTPQCCNNTIIDNTVSDNGMGIYALVTDTNIIYHNSFINNAEQVLLLYSYDIWDNGCEGNYWSDYAGEDLDGDGIGDTLLPHRGVDYYPLMSPYIEGDVNHDAVVDIFDMVTIAVAYGSKPGDPNWNPHADLNEDGIIDINDIVIAAVQFGERW